jgi:hypothetical protein
MELPVPLSVEQQQELRVEFRSLNRVKEQREADRVRLSARIKYLSTQVQNCEAKLAALSRGPTTSSMPSPASETAATGAPVAPAADESIPAWKRNRAERTTAAEAPTAQPENKDGEQPSEARPRRQLERGAAFGFLRGAMAQVNKESAASEGLLRQRLAQQNAVERKQVESELGEAAYQLGQVRKEAAQLLGASVDEEALAADVVTLERIVNAMPGAEAAYCEAHFLKAEGAHYDIAFVPIAHTEHSKVALDDQRLAAATVYMESFRREADLALKQAALKREARLKMEPQSGGVAPGFGGGQQQQQHGHPTRRGFAHHIRPRE